MKTQNAFRLLAVASVAALIAAPAFSQVDTYNYGGISVGSSRSNFDDAALLTPPLGGTLNNLHRDRSDRGWRVFGGRQLSPLMGVEAGYFDLGRFGFNADMQPTGTVSGSQRVQGLNLDLVGTMAVTPSLAVLGRVGAVYTRSRASIDASMPVARSATSDRGAGVKAGIGLQYAINPSMLVRGEVERYRVRDAGGSRGNVDLASVSLVFPFGRAPGVTGTR